MPIQIDLCRSYAEREGLTITEVYSDVMSGAKDDRPGLSKLFADLRRYEAVVLYAQDRLARDVVLAHQYLKAFHDAGVTVHSVMDGPLERGLVYSIKSAVSEDERNRISQRTYSGLLAKAKAGFVPTNIQLYGYSDVPGTGRVKVNPLEAELVRRIFELGAGGATYRDIARDINAREDRRQRNGGVAWQPSHLSGMIRQSAYKGEYLWPRNSKRGTQSFKIEVPAIVDINTWTKAQRRKVGRPARTDRPLVGHLRCGLCGRGVSSTHNKHSGSYLYRCNYKGHVDQSRRCKLKTRHGPTLDRQVDEAVREAFADREWLRFELAKVEPHDDPNAYERAAIKAEDARWLEAFQLGVITPQELGTYRAELRERERALSPLEQPIGDYPLDEYVTAAREMPLKEMLVLFDVMVIVYQDQLEVTLGT